MDRFRKVFPARHAIHPVVHVDSPEQGDTPLAIASGITPENVEVYLPFADSFLVATGISRSFTELDPSKVRMLVQRVRSYGR